MGCLKWGFWRNLLGLWRQRAFSINMILHIITPARPPQSLSIILAFNICPWRETYMPYICIYIHQGTEYKRHIHNTAIWGRLHANTLSPFYRLLTKESTFHATHNQNNRVCLTTPKSLVLTLFSSTLKIQAFGVYLLCAGMWPFRILAVWLLRFFAALFLALPIPVAPFTDTV